MVQTKHSKKDHSNSGETRRADPGLLAGLKNHDPALLETIFTQTNPMLFKVLASNRIVGETAEDLVHQTWERFFTNLEQFEGRSELSTFICGILINKIRENRRATGRIVYEEDADGVLDKAFAPQGWWNTPPPDPSSRLYSAQLSDLIGECMEGLSELQKSAFVLKEVEEEDSDAICNILNVSNSNLRVLIFRAKDKLKQCLEGQLGTVR